LECPLPTHGARFAEIWIGDSKRARERDTESTRDGRQSFGCFRTRVKVGTGKTREISEQGPHLDLLVDPLEYRYTPFEAPRELKVS
jgi:hypothetical protein